MSTADEQFLTSLLLAQGHTREAVQIELEALPAASTSNEPRKGQKAVHGLPGGSQRRREKMFGFGRPRALDRNAKVRIMHWARCLSRRTEKGRAYGVVTAKALAVMEAMLWAFHNAKSGLCFPSYETIAEAAHCARSTVAEAIRALEDAGILSWVQRIKRVREPCSDLLGDNGWRWRILRTSNAYHFRDPGAPDPSKSEKPTGTPTQDFFSSLGAAFGGERSARSGRKEAFRRGAAANVRA
jgi:Helix-turn-helix domain